MNRKRKLLLSWIVLVILVSSAVWFLRPAPRYSIAAIGVPSDRPRQINNAGQVIGCWDPTPFIVPYPPDSEEATLRSTYFFWSEETGALRPKPPQWEGFPHLLRYGFNDRGQIFWIRDGTTLCSWSPANGYRDLADLSKEATDIFGISIQAVNNRNQVVGLFGIGRESHLCIWDATDGLSDLGCIPGLVVPTEENCIDLNDCGQVVGLHTDAGITTVAVGDRETGLRDVLAVEGWFFRPKINDVGQVLVRVMTSPAQALLWSPSGVLTEIRSHEPSVGALASGLNDKGQVVGMGRRHSREPGNRFPWFWRLWNRVIGYLFRRHGGFYPRDTTRFAFLYEKGAYHDLNDLLPRGTDWYLERATDINDRGQIVGEGFLQGTLRTFLLTPIE